MAFYKWGILSFVLLLQNKAGNHTGCCCRAGGSGFKDDTGLCKRDARPFRARVFPPVAVPWAASAFSAPAARGAAPAALSSSGSSIWSLCGSWLNTAKLSRNLLLQGGVVTKPVQELKLLKPYRAGWWRPHLPRVLFDSRHIMWKAGNAWEGLIIEIGQSIDFCSTQGCLCHFEVVTVNKITYVYWGPWRVIFLSLLMWCAGSKAPAQYLFAWTEVAWGSF